MLPSASSCGKGLKSGNFWQTDGWYKRNKCGTINKEERTEGEGVEILLRTRNPENWIRIKIQESLVIGQTLMTREHNKKKAVSELAWHQSALTYKRKKKFSQRQEKDRRFAPE